nr:folate-binding protein YgfZ [Phytoactinopolyspora halophila]
MSVNTSYRSPLLDVPGAVEAAEPDTGVAAHYGEPFREQRNLVSGQGAVDLSHRDVVKVSGPDRLTWLHQLVSQHLEELSPGEPTAALVLDVKGRVEHAMYGVDDGSALWFHLERGSAESLVQYLDAMRFWSQVEVTDVTDEFAIVWEATAASDVAQPDPAPDGAETDGGNYVVRPAGRGRDVFVPRAELRSYVEAAGPPAGIWAYEALRIEAHEPRHGRDTDERTIPHEVGWIGSAVHLDKGCYRGQETVARVHTLGRPPRRLVMLHLDGSVDHLPERGDDVVAGERTVGFVGSAVRHHELGPIGLAVIKRNVPVDAPLLAGGVAAAQEVIVDPEIGLHVRPQVR